MLLQSLLTPPHLPAIVLTADSTCGSIGTSHRVASRLSRSETRLAVAGSNILIFWMPRPFKASCFSAQYECKRATAAIVFISGNRAPLLLAYLRQYGHDKSSKRT